jgi:hypothetical protein
VGYSGFWVVSTMMGAKRQKTILENSQKVRKKVRQGGVARLGHLSAGVAKQQYDGSKNLKGKVGRRCRLTVPGLAVCDTDVGGDVKWREIGREMCGK